MGEAMQPSRTSGAIMRIAFVADPPGDSIFGGYVVQRDRTREALQSFGHHVDLVTEPGLGISGYDVLHFWTGDVARIDACNGFTGARVASVVYVSRAFRERFVRKHRGIVRYVLSRARGYGRSLIRPASARGKSEFHGLRHLLDRCQLFIALAEEEAASLRSELGIAKPHHVVRNGADDCFANASDRSFRETYGLRNFVLCVGRFEPLKNQERLIDVAATLDAQLVLIGRPHPHHMEYFARCRARFGPRVLHIPHLEPSQLASAYAAADVVAQPSHYEAASLACLEAGLAGKKIVTTDRSYHREYFGDLVWYCDPANSKSIRDAISAAMSSPPSDALSRRIASEFSWRNAATSTLEAYHRAIELASDSQPRRMRSSHAPLVTGCGAS